MIECMTTDSVRELLDKIKHTIESEGLSSEYLQLMRAMPFIRKVVDGYDR